MVYVTGDVHGDLSRFKSKEAHTLKKNDTLIVCGDFGFVWDGGSAEQKALTWIGKRPYRVLFVEGTHDNLDMLEKYPTVDFCGAKARQISGGCYQLMRGQIYKIEDDEIFTFGGGESSDMDMRTPGETWWERELPSFEEISFAMENLEAHMNKVDYIITHVPTGKLFQLLRADVSRVSYFDTFLDDVSSKIRYKRWFFGSLHMDKMIPPLHCGVYKRILPIKGVSR